MSQKYRALWSSKVLIFWVIVAIFLFLTNTSIYAIAYNNGYPGFFNDTSFGYNPNAFWIPFGYYPNPYRYYGPVPPADQIIYPQKLYFEGIARGYTGGTGGYYPGSIYSQYYDSEGVYNPTPNPFLPMYVLYYEGEPIGYSSGTGFYYPGSFYSEVYGFK